MNKNKKLSVTIGIPAYNEAANIGYLLSDLLKQKKSNYKLQTITVVSDKSTDFTNNIVNQYSHRDSKVVLIRNRKRLGQALSQNKIIVASKNADIYVFLNADIRILSNTFLEKIVEPFMHDSRVGVVCPKTAAIKPKAFFESVINFSVDLKSDMFEKLKSGNNIFTCRGTARAFSGSFIINFRWPKIVGEDAYTYLSAIQKGFTYKYIKDASIIYKSPDNFADHKKQSLRFFSNKQELKKYFPLELVNKEFNIPLTIILKITLIYLIKNPLYFLIYVLITLSIRFSKSKKEGSMWSPAKSSKSLILKRNI